MDILEIPMWPMMGPSTSVKEVLLILLFVSRFLSVESADSDGPKNNTIYQPLFQRPSRLTPRFENVTQQNVNPLVDAAVGLSQGHGKVKRGTVPYVLGGVTAAEGTCGPGTPCSNGACCSKSGFCGYSPDFCGAGNCISNCDAKAECGQYGVPGKNKCPLNVCCSQFGFCGSTSEFCGSGCQSSYGGCGDAPRPSCSASAGLKVSIGYYESWAATRRCDIVRPEDLVLDGLTHLNFAFAFFDPQSFKITPMDANSASLYTRVTALKQKKFGLRVWISIGGWTFNDEINTPNTRFAFSDMAKTAANRKAFIDSLLQFMQTNGFDGMDMDWEYPTADDRGGRPDDTANLVQLCKDIKAAFGTRYGFSVTLPASFWYLRHFDVAEMQPYVDWFNVMTYDIHGVWDKPNKYTGPYVRPHTNITEINEGMDLLWRAGINPDKVVLGIGYYGRSFTLSDPSCKKPGCLFSDGGNKGECSNAVGILTNAEIDRIISSNNLTPTFDKDAAVNWISWDSNQWVSYDDAITMQLKKQYASKLCLHGTMIWAIDQGSTKTNDDYTGIGGGGKFPPIVSKRNLLDAEIIETTAGICYTTFCNKGCKAGFDSVSLMNGQVGLIQFDTTCEKGVYQKLCCPSTSNLGRCSWYGWKGQGMKCNPGCPEGDAELAQNTNHVYHLPSFKEDQTCNGGFQSYCCRGFEPPADSPLEDLSLITGGTDAYTLNDLRKRDLDSRSTEIGTWILRGEPIDPLRYGNDELRKLGALGLYDIPGMDLPFLGYAGPMRNPRTRYGGGYKNPGAIPYVRTSKKSGKSTAKTDALGNRIYGTYTARTYQSVTGSRTCKVTYTCTYGAGYDEICDNQRYGITEVLGGQTVFHLHTGAAGPRTQTNWLRQHHTNYRQWGSSSGVIFGGPHGRCYCEGDEFPMAALAEAHGANAPQAIRQVDGIQNGFQGADFRFWSFAEYAPCYSYQKSPPAITWAFNTLALHSLDPRKNSNAGFIRKYGFDSQIPVGRCFARVTGGAQASTIADHGFRVHIDDTMFYSPFSWNSGRKQDWKSDPLGGGRLPSSVDSALWLRKRSIMNRDDFVDTPPPAEPTHGKWSKLRHARFHAPKVEPGKSFGDIRPSNTATDQATPTAVPIHHAPRVEEEAKNATSSLALGQLFARDTVECPIDDADDQYGLCDCQG